MNIRLLPLLGTTFSALLLISPLSPAQTPYDDFNKLIPGRDDAKIDKLFSDLSHGGSDGTSAAETIGKTGQASLLPRLESFLFTEPEKPKQPQPPEPQPPSLPGHTGNLSGDVIFPRVSEDAFEACAGIVKNSPEISPRLKDWFAMFHEAYSRLYMSGLVEGKESSDLLKQWWSENKERMAAGEFAKLTPVPLWPEDVETEDNLSVPFARSDYMKALRSKFDKVRWVALKTIKEKNWMVSLTNDELKRVSECLATSNISNTTSAVRSWACLILSSDGAGGHGALMSALDDPDADVRQYAAWALLALHPVSTTERTRCVVALIGGSSTNFTELPFSLKTETTPLLERKALDAMHSDKDRAAAMKWHTGNNSWSNKNSGDDGEYESQLRTDMNSWASKRDDSVLVGYLSDLTVEVGDNDSGNAASELGESGPRGAALLKAALFLSNVKARGFAAMTLLDLGSVTPEEKTAYVAAMVNGMGANDGDISNYLRQHPELTPTAMPVLKQRVLDSKVPEAERTFAALLIAEWATKDDLPYLESLLATTYPNCVRGTAVHAICRLYPLGEPPASVQVLAADPDLGPMIKTYRYLEKVK